MGRRVRVRVPATTANLGPGFDCLGMALQLHNEVIAEVAEQGLSITVEGEGMLALPRDESNLIYSMMRLLYDQAGRQVPPLRLTFRNGIPLDRGLGSSAAAIVSGLVTANALCGGPFDYDGLLRLAARHEGHPDNVSPALLGGAVVAVYDGSDVHWCRLHVPPLRVVLLVPDFAISTHDARRLLPALVSRSDAVHNVGRASLLVAALANGCLDRLRFALEDRLHQPYRESLFPGMRSLFAAAMDAGALGAFLSGAGSTLAALCEDGAERVAAHMEERARTLGISAHATVTAISSEGATVEHEE